VSGGSASVTLERLDENHRPARRVQEASFMPRKLNSQISRVSRVRRALLSLPVPLGALCALGALGALAFVEACAVGGDDSRVDAPGTQLPPSGLGGAGGSFNPGDGGPNGSGASYGSGASSNAGGSGGSLPDAGPDVIEEPKPPECGDDLKRCDHEFSYPDSGETSVVVRGSFAADGWTVGVPMTKTGGSWQATVPLPWNVDVQYKFYVDDAQWVIDPGNPAQADDGVGGKNSLVTGATCAFWSCADPPLVGTYDWRDAVLYFVFVDRFLDGDPANNGAPTSGVEKPADFQGGDWAGVKQKVEEGYFNDLGVTALWLTVPLDNASSAGLGTGGDTHLYSAYHGYWPTNVDKTEEHFGSKDELKALVDAAHAKGLKVLFDYAMNHVHKDSPVYAQHPDWFWPLSDDKVQNCVCGQGCSWDDAELAKRCWFTDYLPDFNFNNADARKFSVDNAVQWIKDTGIDGFRLDAMKHIETSWLTDLRARVTAEIEPTSGQHFYMVGETFTGDKGLIKSYVDPQSKLDGQFDFPLRMQVASTMLLRQGSMKDLDGFLGQNDTFYGAGLMSTFIGNHDIPRAVHLAEDTPVWGDQWSDGKDRSWNNLPGQPGGAGAYERLGNTFTLLLTMRGVPLIYYGDEVGLAGGGDPDNRRMMQWSGYNAGQQSLFTHIKKLNAIRKDHAALRRGTRQTIFVSDEVLAYKMSTAGDTVYVAINRGDGDQPAEGLPAGALEDLLTGEALSGPGVTVKARSARVLIAK
jgi:glycosidase